MRRLLEYLTRRGIGVQIAIMVVIPPVLIHVAITSFILLHANRLPPEDDPRGHDLGAVLRILAATPQAERAVQLDALRRAEPQFDLQLLPPDAVPTAAATAAAPRWPGFGHLGPRFRLFPLTGVDAARTGVLLPDGTAVAVTMVDERPSGPSWFGPWSTALLSIVISIALLSLWASQALTAPLSAFARTAESFSLDGGTTPLPENGPDEVRRVARALNRMQERITALMRDRTQMLAAISHDLRTPITRLRLRTEFIQDASQRTETLRDLDQMRTMLDAVLSLLRNDHAREPMTRVDLIALLQLVCDQFTDLGHDVALVTPVHAVIRARQADLIRAVTNLVENAVRYGPHVGITLTVGARAVTIEVEDDGPGIDDASKAAMLEPFVRGDAARNLDDTGGFGLGLSITSTIITTHDGVLSLHDRAGGGLTARITLPTGTAPSAT